MTAAEVANLAVRISLEDKLTGGIAKMTRTLGKFDASAGRTGKGVKQLTGGLLKVGVIAGAAVATGLGLAARTAIGFDDAFAAVAKTVEASKPDLQALNDQLHALATRIPVDYTDLAGIAAEAGALGVPTKSVAKFTEVVARLSAATQGLTPEAAAEAFGKFRNTLKITDSQLTNTASALIALGNAGASSEADIIEVGKRFAAAGHLAGLSAADVLGFSSAITSLGVEPEAAGSSLSRLFNNITKYIGTGDKKIVAFAKTAGVSVKTFSHLFAHDAKGAVLDFLQGLSKLDKFQATAALKKAGITNVRDINAVLLLSQNYKELARQLGVSETAFKQNTALTDVSAKRFDTLKNKLKVLSNNFKEAGYDIASGFLPALGRAADKLTAFLQKPENVKLLKSIGTDLGHALDKVNFDKLLGVAKGLAQALDPALKIVLKLSELIAKLPPQLIGAGGAFIVGDKLTGGALSGGIGNILGGLGGTLAKSLAAQIPFFGKAFVQPVFVTNPGFGGGGGIPGALGAAAGGIGLGGVLAVALTAGSVAALGLALHDAVTNHPGADGALARDANGNVKPGQVFTTQHGFGRAPGNPSAGPTANHVFIDGIKGNVFAQGPTSRDGDKNLATAAQALTTLKTHGINLQAIAGARLLALGVTEKGVQSNIRTLKERLHNAITAEGRATRAGDSRHAAQLAAKEAAIRAQLSAANAKLAAIRAKKTSLTTNVAVNVNTSVSVSALQKQARYSSKVARTTSLAAR